MSRHYLEIAIMGAALVLVWILIAKVALLVKRGLAPVECGPVETSTREGERCVVTRCWPVEQ